MTNKWLFGKKTDLLILFVPLWCVWLFFVLSPYNYNNVDAPLWVWLVFVLLFDVGHVWSTLFRTYFNPTDKANHGKKLYVIPAIVFAALLSITFLGETIFWGLLTYVAIHHFMKQQWGFMKIYEAKSGTKPQQIIPNSWVIYGGMLAPVLFWHFDEGRSFNWFIENEFLPVASFSFSAVLATTIPLVYGVIFTIWFVQVLLQFYKKQATLSLPLFLWIVTTAINWHIGIVWFNSDLIFTITNVVAHGLPYFVLVTFYFAREREKKLTLTLNPFLKYAGIVVLIAVSFAFFEELLWDYFINKDKTVIFSGFVNYDTAAKLSPLTKNIIIALLALPQTTHYVLDRFIWKTQSNPNFKKYILNG